MSRLVFCMVVDLWHAAARMHSRIAAAVALCFIYPSQLYDNLCMSAELLQALASAKVYDLAHTYRVGMPHHPVHPPYLFGLTKAHGEYMRGDVSSAAEAITLGGHVGTHIDALCHFSKMGKVFGGAEIVQSYAGGVGQLSIDKVGPIV